MTEPVRPPDVSSRPSIGACHEYVPTAGAEKRESTVVIAPIRIKQTIGEDGTYTALISFSCNRGIGCYSANCVYAKNGRTRQ